MKSGKILFNPFLPEETKDLSTLTIISDPSTKISIYDPESPHDMERLQADSGMKGKIIEEKIRPPITIFRNENEDFGFGVVSKKEIKKGEDMGAYLGEVKIVETLTEEEQAYAFNLEPLPPTKRPRPMVLAHDTGSLEAGASTDMTTLNGKTIKEYAAEKGCSELLEVSALKNNF